MKTETKRGRVSNYASRLIMIVEPIKQVNITSLTRNHYIFSMLTVICFGKFRTCICNIYIFYRDMKEISMFNFLKYMLSAFGRKFFEYVNV